MKKQPRPPRQAPWDQTAFDEWQASLPPERLAEDEKLLQTIFGWAKRVPHLAEELAWAQSHGIKFFIDRTAVGVGGYYVRGAGVLCITEKWAQSPHLAIEGLAHEIRHAWQDYHGYRSYLKDQPVMPEYWIKDALPEADAYAFGKLAVEEYKLNRLKRLPKTHPDRAEMPALQASLVDPLSLLSQKFLAWFSDITMVSKMRISASYGDSLSKSIGAWLSLYQEPATPVDDKSASPSRRYEFPGAASIISGSRTIDLCHMDDLFILGKTFAGAGNYMTRVSSDTLLREVLSPTLANTFWGAANNDQHKLMRDIRRTLLRQKLAHRLPKTTP